MRNWLANYFGAWWMISSASVIPRAYVNGLAKRPSAAWGLPFRPRARHQRFSQPNGRQRQISHRNHPRLTHAKKVFPRQWRVYTSEATPTLRRKVIPIGSYIIATKFCPKPSLRKSVRSIG